MPPKEKKGKIDLKVPKGTKDWEGKDMVIRDRIFNGITTVFKRHGGVTIDTPYARPTILLRPHTHTERETGADSRGTTTGSSSCARS